MKVRIITCILLLMLMGMDQNASATTQIPDRLHTGVWTHEVHGGDIPQEKIYGINHFEFLAKNNTACWRGYVAEWKVLNGLLYLVSAKDFDGNPLSSDAERLTADGPVLASWVSGEFFSPKLSVLFVPNDLLGGMYFGYLVYDFKDGQLQSRRFRVEPIGAAIWLAELSLIWLFARRIVQRRRKRHAQPTSLGGVATRAAPEK